MKKKHQTVEAFEIWDEEIRGLVDGSPTSIRAERRSAMAIVNLGTVF